MTISPVTLEGQHVRLEPMRLEHYERLAEIGLGQNIFRCFPIAIDTKEQMLAYVRACVAANETGTMLTWITVSREIVEPVGTTGYPNIDKRNRKPANDDGPTIRACNLSPPIKAEPAPKDLSFEQRHSPSAMAASSPSTRSTSSYSRA
jgi:hypothetical protein